MYSLIPWTRLTSFRQEPSSRCLLYQDETLIDLLLPPIRDPLIQIEPRFSDFAKGKLATLVEFVIVRVLSIRYPRIPFSPPFILNFSISPYVCPQNDCLPAESLYHASLPHHPYSARWATIIPIMEELKVKAKKLGLWNLFLSKKHYPEHGVDLTNLEVGDLLSL